MCHKSVLERKRKDPRNPETFVKICDKCNKAYLERQLLMPFWKNCRKIKVVVDDREKHYERFTDKLNKLETELVNIRRLNDTKESDIDQRYTRLDAEHQEVKEELERTKEEMADHAKRLGRIDSEFIQAEMHIKEQRIHYEKQ